MMSSTLGHLLEWSSTSFAVKFEGVTINGDGMVINYSLCASLPVDK